jgi:hypothetical protein
MYFIGWLNLVAQFSICFSAIFRTAGRLVLNTRELTSVGYVLIVILSNLPKERKYAQLQGVCQTPYSKARIRFSPMKLRVRSVPTDIDAA